MRLPKSRFTQVKSLVEGGEDLSTEVMPYEVLNALKYTKLFEKEELVLIAKSLTLYGFRLFSLSGELAQRTVKIAVDKDVTIYDASYVALAEELRAELYTADEKLIESVNSDFVKHISEFC